MEILQLYADRCLEANHCHPLTTCIEGICVHKEVWPLHVLDVLLWLCIFTISALGNAAGVSGGVVIIPLVIWIGGFSTHYALPIVNLVAFGGLAVALAYRFPLRDSVRPRPRIEYRLALFMCVPLLLGTSFGVMGNAMLPEWLLLLLLLLTLIYVTYTTFSQ